MPPLTVPKCQTEGAARSDASELTVSPNGFNLGNIEKQRVHETQDVESHLLRRECAAALGFDAFGNRISSVHEARATRPLRETKVQPFVKPSEESRLTPMTAPAKLR